MITNLTNITVVGSPDYYLELESGKPYGYVGLTRESTTTDIQLSNCWIYYKFKMTSGNPSNQNMEMYILYDNTDYLVVSKIFQSITFRLSIGPNYSDIGVIDTSGANLELNHWYEVVIYQDGGIMFSLRDSESGDELASSGPYTDSIDFNIRVWNISFNSSSALNPVVSKDTRIEIQDTSEAVLDLSGIEWDPVPSIDSFGTTNAI